MRQANGSGRQSIDGLRVGAEGEGITPSGCRSEERGRRMHVRSLPFRRKIEIEHKAG